MTWFETGIFTQYQFILMSFLLALQNRRIFHDLNIDLSKQKAVDHQKMEKKAESKARAPNFTEQECHLLASLMGETYSSYGMSKHKLDKHKFTESK